MAEDLPPFGKNCERFLCKTNIAILYLPMTQNDTISSVSTSPNRTEITKLVLNNNNYICLCIVFAMTSKVWKKWKNFKINRKSGRLKNSLKAEDLPFYRKTWQVCEYIILQTINYMTGRKQICKGFSIGQYLVWLIMVKGLRNGFILEIGPPPS